MSLQNLFKNIKEVIVSNAYLRYFFVFVALTILFIGNVPQLVDQHGDIEKYSCYANGFWYGNEILKTTPDIDCYYISSFYENTGRYTVIPLEYPILTIIPFLTPLMVPFLPYPITFGFLLILLILAIFFLIQKTLSTRKAFIFLIFILVGSFNLAIARIDLLPAFFTLLAGIYALKKKYFLAYIALICAIFLKWYALLLIPPLMLYQYQSTKKEAFKKLFKNVFLSSLVVIGIVSLSVFLTLDGTLSSFFYFKDRPFQIESLPASLLWISTLSLDDACISYTYGSIGFFQKMGSSCKFSAGYPQGTVSQVISALMLAGMTLFVGFTLYQQWKKRITILQSFFLILIIGMLCSKVFSPQYLLWITPLIPFVLLRSYRSTLTLIIVYVLTTAIYPYGYPLLINEPLFFFIVVGLRNVLFVFFLCDYFHIVLNKRHSQLRY